MNSKNLPKIMYDQSQFTPIYFIDESGGWINDKMYADMKKIAGYAPDAWYLYTQLRPNSFFFGAYDFKALKNESLYGYRNFSNKKWVKKFENDIDKMYFQTKDIARTYFKEISGKPILDNKETIISFLKKVRKAMTFNMAHYHLTQPQEFYGFQEFFKNQSNSTDLLVNNASRLTSVMELRKSILEYAEKASLENLSAENLKKKYPKEFLKSMGIINKLGFLNRGLFGGDSIDEKYLLKEANRLRKIPSKLSEELNQTRYVEARIRDRNRVIYKNSQNKVLRMADIVGHGAALRFNMQTYGLCLMRFAQDIFDDIGKNFKLRVEDLPGYKYDELIDLLRHERKILPETLEKRKKGFLRIFSNKGISTYVGEDARGKIKELLKFREKEHLEVKPLRGAIASTPKKAPTLTGDAFVLTTAWNNEMKNFKKGQILIATQTHPHLMPIIKKAKAIITDEGGVTCHAAIVSRELGIPAIIGTRLATKIFKTGDKIEMDFKKGIVRKTRGLPS